MPFTLAMPKQSKLLKPFIEALEQADFDYNQERSYIFDNKNNLPAIATRTLRDMDALADLCDGTIDIAPIGLNAFEEFNSASGYTAPIRVRGEINLSKCTLSLAGTLEDNIRSLADTKGRTIITTYPETLKVELEKIGITSLIVPQWQTERNAIEDAEVSASDIATIVVRKGRIEEKAAEMKALVFDLVQTGQSLEDAGFDLQSSLPVLESLIVLVQPKNFNLNQEGKDTFNAFIKRVEIPDYGTFNNRLPTFKQL